MSVGLGKEEKVQDKVPCKGSKFSRKEVKPQVSHGCTYKISLNAVNPNENKGELFGYFKVVSLSRYSPNHLNEPGEYDCLSDII